MYTHNQILYLMILASLVSLISYGAVNWVRLYLSRQLIDIPNMRSSHVTPTPRGGGLGFIAAFIPIIVAYNVLLGSHMPTLPWLLWACFLPLIGVGLLDDWKNLPAVTRYCVQLSVATLLVLQIGVFPQPWLEAFGIIGHSLAFAITVVGVTAAMNFYNFMDGLDGLVGGCCTVQSIFCAIYLNQPSLWLLAAALLGFLVLNWSPAKIFMGDAGSTFLGAVIPTFLLISAQASQGRSPGEAWAALVVTLPLIADALYTLYRRWRNGENIFQAHRSHLYQRLNQAGLPHSTVAAAYILTTILLAINCIVLGTLGSIMSVLALGCAMIWAEQYIKTRATDSFSVPSLTKVRT